MAALTALPALPPSTAFGVDVPYAVVVPYSKWYVVSSLLGFTTPLSVALEAVTSVASVVVAPGASARAAAGRASARATRRPRVRRRLIWEPCPFEVGMKPI